MFSGRKKLRWIRKALEFERVQGWIIEEQCSLLADLAFESNPGRNEKFAIGAFEPVSELTPRGHVEHDAEVPCRNRIAVNRVHRGRVAVVIDEMQCYLMPEEIEVCPARGRTALLATQKAAIKGFCSLEVGYRNCQMKRSQFSHGVQRANCAA